MKDPVRTLALGQAVKAAHQLANTALGARRMVAHGIARPLDPTTLHTIKLVQGLARETIGALEDVLEAHREAVKRGEGGTQPTCTNCGAVAVLDHEDYAAQVVHNETGLCVVCAGVPY